MTVQQILPQPPLELIDSKYPIDLKVWYKIVLLADSNPDSNFFLPCRNDMVKICGCGTHQLTASYKRLAGVGIHYIKTSNKKTRPMVRIIYQKPVVSLQTFEGIGEVKTKISINAKPGDSDNKQVYIKYNPHPLLLEALKHSPKFSNISAREITALSYNAPIEEIIIAMAELEVFKPLSGSLLNLHGAFRKRFNRTKEGGRLNPYRQNQIWKSTKNLSHKLLSLLPKDVKHSHTFHPVLEAGITASSVDRFCDKLNNQQWAEKYLVSVKQLVACENAIENHRDENHLVKLRDGLKLLKVKGEEGCWDIILDEKCDMTLRSKKITSISSALSHLKLAPSED